MTFKEIAELYADKEISVVPINDKKIPDIGEGWNQIFFDQVFQPKYDKYWARAKGIGLLCGEPSGIILLDIDITDTETNPLKVALREELLKMLPPIFAARRGSKIKPPARFFKYEGQSTERFKSLDVEILSTGTHCGLPPSHHSAGHLYEWVGKELLNIEVDDLPSLPEEVLVWLREKNLAAKGEYTQEQLLRSEKGRCKSGSHNYISSIGVALRYAGHEKEAVIARLIAEDHKINRGEDSLYFQCKTRRWASRNVEENAKQFVDVIFANHKVDPIAEKYPSKKDGFFVIDDKGKWHPATIELIKYMKNELCLKTKDDAAFIFDQTHYRQISKQGIENKIYHLTNLSANTNELGNMSKMVRTYCHYDPDFINPQNCINVGNGILNTDNMTLLSHDKNKFFTYRLKHNYTTSKNTPVFDRFLKLISTEEKDKELLIKEFIGYILSGCDYSKFNNILILDGIGANGKTSLINIIEKLVGLENCASESLDSLKDNRFSLFNLVGKMVNFCAEEPKEAFSNTGILKKLTGNDPLMAEPKHQKSFQFINYAKFVISYNEMPFLADRTQGMKRRLLIVPCNADLVKNPDLKIKDLQSVIKPEYGAIMNQCLLAFRDVQERGDFTLVQSGLDRYEEIAQQSDPVLDFVKNKVILFAELPESTKSKIGLVTQKFGNCVTLANSVWPEFEKFAGHTKIEKRGFDMRFSKIIQQLYGIKKEREKSGDARDQYYYNGIILESNLPK